MEYKGWSCDRSNPFAWKRSLVIENSTSRAQRNRVHILDEAFKQFSPVGGKAGNDCVVGTHQLHELLLEQLGDGPVKQVILEDGC